jgi:hypothetical protein
VENISNLSPDQGLGRLRGVVLKTYSINKEVVGNPIGDRHTNRSVTIGTESGDGELITGKRELVKALRHCVDEAHKHSSIGTGHKEKNDESRRNKSHFFFF